MSDEALPQETGAAAPQDPPPADRPETVVPAAEARITPDTTAAIADEGDIADEVEIDQEAGIDEGDDLGEDEDEGADAVGFAAGGLTLALSFLTRLPLGSREPPPPGKLARAMGTFPLVGVVIGGIGAALYAVLHQGLPASAAALLAVAATILITGGLHEDGLADTADGFGGGADRGRKLAIMRDSRIGTFGVLAVVLSVGLRATAIAQIGDSLTVAGALVAAHALARAAIPVAMQALAPARADGLGAAAGQPSGVQAGVAVTIAVIVAALVLPVSAALAALAGATIGFMAVVALAEKQIGGHTGDVLGAVEQAAETLALLGALSAL